MSGLLAAIEATAVAETLRISLLLYPLVSALHILGIALLVGAVLALDLRVAGLWRADGWRTAVLELSPVAAAGLALAVVTGALLFSVRAGDYADNPAMLIKWGLIVIGLFNTALFHSRLKRQVQPLPRVAPLSLRVMAVVSALVWIAALFAGRWVAFAG